MGEVLVEGGKFFGREGAFPGEADNKNAISDSRSG
jgi:hypothetical protein